MRYFFLALLLLGVLILGVAGLRGSKSTLPPLEFVPDMDHQAKVKHQVPHSFFSDRLGARRHVAGTIPMGFEVPEKSVAEGGKPSAHGFGTDDSYFSTGRMGEYFGDGLPDELTVDQSFLEVGQKKFEIYCAVCHGASGDGQGVVSKRGFGGIANLQELRLRDNAQTPDGSIYHTIVHGKGNMGGYGSKLSLNERWAIVAYLRALQASQRMPMEKVKDEFEAWESSSKPAPEAAENPEPSTAN